MGVIAGAWRVRDPERVCRTMLLRMGGSDRRCASLGAATVGAASFAGVEVHGTGLRADQRFLLCADLRFDGRRELGAALGLAGPQTDRLADTDLLWQALLRWGDEAIGRLVGDFAFAFFDRAAQRLLLARDPLGQRPLYWCEQGDALAFASMPRGLHTLPGAARAPDLASLARYVAGLPETGSASFYEGVHRVEPGHLLIATGERVGARRYWQPCAEARQFRSFGDGVDAFRAALDEAVADRMRDAGPVVASHLSGGWDSAAVAATAARLAGVNRRVLAFTAVPTGPIPLVDPRSFADEWPLAAAAAALHPAIEHRRIPSSGSDLIDTLARSASCMERPPYNPCNHGWLGRIRHAARQAGATVLLTGEIGNWSISAAPSTILASYVRQGRWRAWAREAAAMLVQRRARLRGVAAASFGPWLPPRWLRSLGRLAAAPPLPIALREPLLASLGDEIEARTIGPLAWPKDHRQRTIAAYQEMDFGAYRKGILAGWGIDKRDATADLRLIQFCLSLPLEMLLGNGMRRPLARAALSDRLPHELLSEPRKGLQAADWHLDLERSRPGVEALVSEIEQHPAASAFIDTGLLRSWLRAWPNGDWHRPDIVARYRMGLLVSLAAGHFAIHASGQSTWDASRLGLATNG